MSGHPKEGQRATTHLLTLNNGMQAWGTDALTIRIDALSVGEGTSFPDAKGAHDGNVDVAKGQLDVSRGMDT